MATRSQPMAIAALRPVVITADEVEHFSGKRPALPEYRLEPVEDQGDQYELAFAFDDDDDGEEGDEGATAGAAVNPFYGIPFGVAMLLARDEAGEPAGFITFRHDLHEIERRPGHPPRAQYDFKIFVFMVRADLRSQGYGSALAVSCLSTIRDDLRAICGTCPEGIKPEVAVRFVGEGKSDGGLMLLDRVARNLGILPAEMQRDCGLWVADVAAEIT